MAIDEHFASEARLRLDRFYQGLARTGEVAPVARLRLEGFLEAGLVLDLAARDGLSQWIDEAISRHLGASPPLDTAGALLDSDDGGVVLPVRWQRAPVHPS